MIAPLTACFFFLMHKQINIDAVQHFVLALDVKIFIRKCSIQLIRDVRE